MTGASSRTDRVMRWRARSTRTTRLRSLHATHAVLPPIASVIVGQKGPAAAQARTARAPGLRRSAVAAGAAVPVPSAAATTSAASTIEPFDVGAADSGAGLE